MRARPSGGVTVITGASSGIGQATAEAFARCGGRLFLAARGLDALQKVAAICRELGAREATAVEVDVTDAAAVKALAERAVREAGSIDTWVSTVGVGAVGRFEDTPVEAHEQVVRANLIGHINDAHAALPVFLRQGHGVFVNMISLGGFAEALRAELRDHPGVRICDVYPAFVDTPGLRHGANYVGKELSAPPPVADARTVARAIVRLADRPKATTIVGSVAWFVRLAHALAPDLTAAAMARFMRAYFRRAAPTRMSDGNLFAPPAIAGGIDGGLRANAPSHAALAAGAIVLGAGCLALLLARSRA